MDFNALLLLSFGGPEQPDEVMPFLRQVTKGRNVPERRLTEVKTQYDLFGGKSPLNDQCRELKAAIELDFQANDINLPVYWGNRNSAPFVADTVRQMGSDGVTKAAVFVTSAFGSYSGCRQYREDLEAARAEVGDAAPDLYKLRLYYNHPGFIEPFAKSVANTLKQHNTTTQNTTTQNTTTQNTTTQNTTTQNTKVVFTAHSIPSSMAVNCSYEQQLREACRLVAEKLRLDRSGWDLAFQSRSGPPSMPWLEPDVNDHLRSLKEQGASQVTLAPIGFTSDHMEVIFDLDTQATQTAQDLEISLNRAPTVGTSPRFVATVRELLGEHQSSGPKLWLGQDGPWSDPCPDQHCLTPARASGFS